MKSWNDDESPSRKDVPRDEILYAGFGTCTESIWVQLPHTVMKETMNAKDVLFYMNCRER